ncbi:hypothetical protein OY671_012421, partial [Metschnikowia pulcherrima]
PCHGPAAGRAQGTRWRGRGGDAVELPAGDDHAQGGAGTGRRSYLRAQAVGTDAALGAGAGAVGGAGRRSGGRIQRGDGRCRRHRRSADRRQAGAQVHLHGQHGGGQAAGRASHEHGDARFAGTGRQRAVHPLRRCRPCGRRGTRAGSHGP